MDCIERGGSMLAIFGRLAKDVPVVVYGKDT